MKNLINTGAFVSAIARPLVRWCLKQGVRVSQVEEVIRTLFVREAEAEIRQAKGGFSISKVSVMTGLHRSEVSRLLSGEGLERGQHDVLNRIIGLWATSKKYRTKDGKIRDLQFEGLSSDFAGLVAAVSKEVTHYPILFELERLGAIEYHGDAVRLAVKEYIPQTDPQYALDLLSVDSSDLISSIEANIVQKFAEPSLHLRTTFDNIPPERLGEIRLWILKKGSEFQQHVREYLAALDRDTGTADWAASEGAPGERGRVAVTTFSYAEKIETSKEIAPKKRGRKPCARD